MPLQPHGKTLCYEAILSMKQSFQLKLGQSLAMTPQLQQAIKLLQLSTLELQQEIHLALESNPMLEMLEAGDAPDDDLPRISEEDLARLHQTSNEVTDFSEPQRAPRGQLEGVHRRHGEGRALRERPLKSESGWCRPRSDTGHNARPWSAIGGR